MNEPRTIPINALGSGDAVIGSVTFEPPNPVITNENGAPFPPSVVEKKPYRCPVCYGSTRVSKGFYSGALPASGTSVLETDPCKACVNGIIWG